MGYDVERRGVQCRVPGVLGAPQTCWAMVPVGQLKKERVLQRCKEKTRLLPEFINYHQGDFSTFQLHKCPL